MDIERIRELFPVTKNYNFQNHAGVSPLCRPAAEAMRLYVDQSLTDAGVRCGFYKHAEQVRRLCARLINATPEEIAFVKNTSEGLGWVAGGLSWNTGDNVVTTNVEFPANIYPWMGLRARGVQLKMIPEESGRVPVERIADAIDSKTRVVSVSAVQFASGYRADLATLGRVCKEKGVLFCVDAIQMLGPFPIDVRAMNIDFLSTGAQKWLCGPEGIGFFFCNQPLIGHLKPVMAGWLGMKNALDFGNYQFEFLDTARKFDTGGYNLAGIYALGAAIQMWLDMGQENVTARILSLTDRLVDKLRAKGYRVISSRRPNEASGIVAFISDVHDHHKIQQHLQNEHRIVIVVREGRLRSSPHVYNTADEIDQLVEVLPAH
ncbi:MAG: aminotransferase class V-fold PLP-dependent enzyme [Phycisphaerae bacterium]|jgi:selenocysteine lyase/cysteine desulfurase